MSRKALAVIVLVLAVCSMCYAQNTDKNTASTAVKVNNMICPVTGDKIDMNNPVTVEYKGEIYNLCCPMCIAEFNKDPEKYSAKTKKQIQVK
jgi:YHS domain-containing protein